MKSRTLTKSYANKSSFHKKRRKSVGRSRKQKRSIQKQRRSVGRPKKQKRSVSRHKKQRSSRKKRSYRKKLRGGADDKVPAMANVVEEAMDAKSELELAALMDKVGEQEKQGPEAEPVKPSAEAEAEAEKEPDTVSPEAEKEPDAVSASPEAEKEPDAVSASPEAEKEPDAEAPPVPEPAAEEEATPEAKQGPDAAQAGRPLSPLEERAKNREERPRPWRQEIKEVQRGGAAQAQAQAQQAPAAAAAAAAAAPGDAQIKPDTEQFEEAIEEVSQEVAQNPNYRTEETRQMLALEATQPGADQEAQRAAARYYFDIDMQTQPNNSDLISDLLVSIIAYNANDRIPSDSDAYNTNFATAIARPGIDARRLQALPEKYHSIFDICDEFNQNFEWLMETAKYFNNLFAVACAFQPFLNIINRNLYLLTKIYSTQNPYLRFMVFFIKSARYSSIEDIRGIAYVRQGQQLQLRNSMEICQKLGILISIWRASNIQNFDDAVTGNNVKRRLGANSFAYNPFKVKSFAWNNNYWQPSGDDFPVQRGVVPTRANWPALRQAAGAPLKLMKEFMVHYGIFGNCLGFSTKRSNFSFNDLA